MTRLRDDTFARRGRRRPRRRYMSAVAFVLVFASIALLVLSRLGHPSIAAVREALTPLYTPLLAAVSKPLAPVREASARLQTMFVSHEELARLRAENQTLRSWEWRARDLERQLRSLSRIAKLAPLPDTPFITARVVASASGPFSRSVIVDVGTARGVKVGHPVLNADGLIGRIVEASDKAARVLLVDDIDMQIPAVIGARDARAIIAGNGAGRPRVTHTKRGAQLADGDVVATSGRGGLFPPALRIGTLVRDDGRFAVRPFADLDRLDFVSVLLFDSPILSLTSKGQARTTSGAWPQPTRRRRSDTESAAVRNRAPGAKVVQ